MRFLRGAGGVTLTANPQTTDVLTGVAFQGVDYPAGSVGTCNYNAFVDYAAIQPPSAWIYLAALNSWAVPDTTLSMGNAGATFILADYLSNWHSNLAGLGLYPALADFSGNALPRSNVMTILDMAATIPAVGSWTVDVSGGTNAAIAILYGSAFDLSTYQPYVDVDTPGEPGWIYLHGHLVMTGLDTVINLLSGSQTRAAGRPSFGSMDEIDVMMSGVTTDDAIDLATAILALGNGIVPIDVVPDGLTVRISENSQTDGSGIIATLSAGGVTATPFGFDWASSSLKSALDILGITVLHN